MKLCLDCRTRFGGAGWSCPACGRAPRLLDGLPAFAPELAEDPAGYPPEVYESLFRAEADSFWFRARNRLLVWALGRWFPRVRAYLEIGCGTGFTAAGLQRAYPGWEITATDSLVSALGYARRRLPGVELLQLDAGQLPFDGEFDLVGAFDVLEHARDDERVLRQLFQAALPGGGLAVTVPQHPRLWSWWDELSHHQRRYRRSELLHKVEAAGFEVLFATSFVSLLLPALWLRRARRPPSGGVPDPAAELRSGRLVGLLAVGMLGLERWLIRAGVSFPAGGSLLLLARRPAA